MQLEAVAAVERLKYRYVRALDTKNWAELEDTMVPDVAASYGEHLSFASRDEYLGFLENTLGTHVITEHSCSRPEIDIAEDGRTATGVWALVDLVLVPEDGVLLRGSAFYHDRYVLGVDGRWRISHTGYERNWEYSVAVDDMPGFRLLAHRWELAQPPRAS